MLAACGSGQDPTLAGPAPEPSAPLTSAPSESAPAQEVATSLPATTAAVAPVWVVGATPLPLRPDGFGEVLPTPPELTDRRLPSRDLLPPPASGAFEATVAPIDEGVRARMGGTWQEGCPVPIEELRYVTLSFWGFDDRPHTGELILHVDHAEAVAGAFRQLFDARFPIEEMRLTTDEDVAAAPTGDGNVTASFICRTVRQGSSFSQHAYGLALDINPFHNPYQRGDLVLPELASAYLDRANVRPGMLLPGSIAVQAFEAIGWQWGGNWSSPDLMHFSANGR